MQFEPFRMIDLIVSKPRLAQDFRLQGVDHEVFHFLPLNHQLATRIANYIHLVAFKGESSVIDFVGLPILHLANRFELLHLLVR